MSSYLILTPQAGPGKDHEKTRFIRDGFSLAAFFFPALWLFRHRFWLLGFGALLLQGLGLELIGRPALWPAGFALLLAVSVIVAVEGRILLSHVLSLRGFVTKSVVSARNLAEAEEIYFSGITEEISQDIRIAGQDIPTRAAAGRGGTALGLIGYDGGR